MEEEHVFEPSYDAAIVQGTIETVDQMTKQNAWTLQKLKSVKDTLDRQMDVVLMEMQYQQCNEGATLVNAANTGELERSLMKLEELSLIVDDTMRERDPTAMDEELARALAAEYQQERQAAPVKKEHRNSAFTSPVYTPTPYSYPNPDGGTTIRWGQSTREQEREQLQKWNRGEKTVSFSKWVVDKQKFDDTIALIVQHIVEKELVFRLPTVLRIEHPLTFAIERFRHINDILPENLQKQLDVPFIQGKMYPYADARDVKEYKNAFETIPTVENAILVFIAVMTVEPTKQKIQELGFQQWFVEYLQRKQNGKRLTINDVYLFVFLWSTPSEYYYANHLERLNLRLYDFGNLGDVFYNFYKQ